MQSPLEPLTPRFFKAKKFAAAAILAASILAFAEEPQGLFFAESLLQKKEWAQAIDVIQEIEAAGGFDDSLYGLKGIALYETGEFSAAIECFSKMAQVKFADKAKWNFNAGCAAMRLDDAPLAEEFFAKSILANKRFAPSYLNRASLRAKAGRYSDAAADYKKYLKYQKDCEQKEEIESLIALLEQVPAEQEPPATFGTKIFPPSGIVE